MIRSALVWDALLRLSLQASVFRAGRAVGRRKLGSGRAPRGGAGARGQEQAAFLESELDFIIAYRACPIIQKYYDATPHKMRFGKLQDGAAAPGQRARAGAARGAGRGGGG